MEPNPLVTSERGNSLHLGEVEDLADDTAHRGFDRNRPNGRRDAALAGTRDLGCSLGQVKRRSLERERDQYQSAQLLHAIAGVVVDVALPLHQYSAAVPRKEAERQMVGERPAGQEDSGFFPEHRRYPLFKLRDDAIPRELVGDDPATPRESRQQTSIFDRRQRQTIRSEVDAVVLTALWVLPPSRHDHLP